MIKYLTVATLEILWGSVNDE